jgi:hypothetical protein
LLGVATLRKKVGVILRKGLLGVDGLPKKGLPFLVSDKRKQGDGGNRTAEKKKSRALAGVSSKPGHVGTHVPCLVYGHVYAGVYACPGLFLPSWGDIKKRGRGRIGSISEKRPQNINAWNWVGVSRYLVGKTERWGQPHRAWTHDYPCLWTGQYPCLWTSLW